MNPIRLVGIILLVVGVLLLVIGWSASESMVDQLSNFFTGRFTDKTMWYLIGGVALVVAGGMMAAMGGRRFAT